MKTAKSAPSTVQTIDQIRAERIDGAALAPGRRS